MLGALLVVDARVELGLPPLLVKCSSPTTIAAITSAPTSRSAMRRPRRLRGGSENGGGGATGARPAAGGCRARPAGCLRGTSASRAAAALPRGGGVTRGGDADAALGGRRCHPRRLPSRAARLPSAVSSTGCAVGLGHAVLVVGGLRSATGVAGISLVARANAGAPTPAGGAGAIATAPANAGAGAGAGARMPPAWARRAAASDLCRRGLLARKAGQPRLELCHALRGLVGLLAQVGGLASLREIEQHEDRQAR